MSNSRNIAVFVIISIITGFAFAQNSKTQLQKKRDQILNEIAQTKKLLNQTKANKDASLADLNSVNKQISLQRNLVNNTQKQVNEYQTQINQKQNLIEEKQKDLSKLKDEYAQAIVLTYKQSKFANKLLFIISADSFSEALRRVNYLRRYAVFRNQQAEEIQVAQKEITSTIQIIEQKKKDKVALLTTQVGEKDELNKTLETKNKIVQDLKGKEKELQTDIKKKQAAAQKLDNQIAAIIKKEIEEAKKKAELEAKKKAEEEAKKNAAKNTNEKTTTGKTEEKTTTTTTPITKTPEAVALSNNFYGNKGKLPWPVTSGFIAKQFGKYEHPDLPGVTIENNGIDIRTNNGASVRTLFEGTVIGIINNPTFKNAVIVNHGDYFSVYSKLDAVNVAKGDKVSTKQVIGTAYTDDDNITEVHLEIWKGTEKLNPSSWIVNK
ncbi:MAG: peptidoglycan DD-metalloendopeptidase family protein [Chitinophagales bacterium]|nr:peptidoglycan DD-metalloendopeptidase family protein [Chitinophagales bacterium]